MSRSKELSADEWLAAFMKWIVRNPKYSIPIVIAVVAGVAWLAFGFFGVHLLFIDDEVDEAPDGRGVARAPKNKTA